MPCFYKKYFGMDCPGCGMQRALVELFKGNLAESFHLYPALLPILFMLAFLGAHLVFKFENGGTWLKYIYIGVAIIITLSYVLKMLGWRCC
ncbi:MAG: DUF2752 domain-containing protein [Flavobacteriales bacterium]